MYTEGGVKARAAPGRAYTHVGPSVNQADDCPVQGPAPREAMTEKRWLGRQKTNFNTALDEIRAEEEEGDKDVIEHCDVMF